MKRLLLIILILCLALPVSAQQIMVVKKKGVSCTTPSGDELTESFGEGSTSCWSGGDSLCNNTWTVYGSASASIVETQSGAQANTACAKSVRVSTPSAIGHIYFDVGSGTIPNNVETVYEFNLYVSEYPDLAQYSSGYMVSFNADTTTVTSTNRYFSFGVYKSSAGTGTPNVFYANGVSCGNFALNTHYNVVVTLDAAGASNGSSVYINGSSACTFTRATVASRYMGIGSSRVGTVVDVGYITITTP